MDLIISIFMLAGVALAIGTIIMLRRGTRKQAVLMGLASLIMFANVAIWLVPTANGATLANPDAR